MNKVKTTVGLFRPRNLELFRMIQTVGNKKQSEMAAVLENEEFKSEWNTAKPFTSIPGPKPLPIPYVGNMWRFLPLFGTYRGLDIVDTYNLLYNMYGDMVRLTGLGRDEVLLLFNPTYVEKMFRNESIWPIREGIQSMRYYRTVTRKDWFENLEGLVTSQGEKWREFRTATNQTMMQPRNVTVYLNPISEVIRDFLERLYDLRDSKQELPENFLEELNKLSLETFGVVVLDTRLGCLEKDLKPDSDAMQMIINVKEALERIQKLDFQPSPWKYISTPTWRKFVNNMDTMYRISMKHINAKWDSIKKRDVNENSSSKNILESLLMKANNPKIAIVMALDTLFAGIDTTSNSIGTALYFLAENPDKQDRLFQEVKKLLPNKNDPVTDEVFNELKYTRAVIKESMRMRPTALGNQRSAVKDMVFGGYQIPKGTQILSANAIMCRLERYFPKPEEYLPERWLASESQSDYSFKKTNPFVFLPFGFGQRSCIGKRFAELEMDVAIAKIIRNFKVSYHYEPMEWVTRVVSVPMKPLKFRIEDRTE